MRLHAHDAWRVTGAGVARSWRTMERPCGHCAAALAARRSCCFRCRSWGVARLLPTYGFGLLGFRLVAASLVLLLPGTLVARALRLRGASATVAWGLGALGLRCCSSSSCTARFCWRSSCSASSVSSRFRSRLRVVSGPPAWDTLAIAFLGLAFGVALWHVAGVVSGDALFHPGRVQKLYSFGDLHVARWTSSPDGGLIRIRLPALARVPGPRREGRRSGPTQVMLPSRARCPGRVRRRVRAGLALFVRPGWARRADGDRRRSPRSHRGTAVPRLLSQPGTLDRHVR